MNTQNGSIYASHARAVRWVHLYVNGLYWGLYNATERIDGDFMSSRFGEIRPTGTIRYGRNPDDFETYQFVEAGVEDGIAPATIQADLDVCTAAAALQPGQENHALWQAVLAVVDVENLINYHLLGSFYVDSNWHSGAQFGRRKLGLPLSQGDHAWRFFCWDTENEAMGSLPADLNAEQILTTSGGGQLGIRFIESLLPCPLFREKLWQRSLALLQSGGLLHQSTSLPRWLAIKANFRKVFWSEAALRLTTSKLAASPSASDISPAQLESAWLAECAKAETWLNQRPAMFLSHIAEWLGRVIPN